MQQSDNRADDDARLAGLAQAPEFFVEGYAGATMRDGVAKLSFFSYVHDPARGESWPQARVTLAVPVEDLREIVEELDRLLKRTAGEAPA